MKSYDLASGGDLLRDFHYVPQGTFLVDLPNGRYEVVLSMGDAGTLHDQMGIFLEGSGRHRDHGRRTICDQNLPRGCQRRTADVEILDQGGSSANVVINALEVIVAGRTDWAREWSRNFLPRLSLVEPIASR